MPNLRARLLLLSACAALLTTPWLGARESRAVDPLVAFTEVAATNGIGDVRCHSAGGHGIGVVWLDFDLNQFPDLFVACGYASRRAPLFRNLGDGTFADASPLLPELPADVDVQGAVAGDYDNDGDPDLYILADKYQWDFPFDRDGAPNLMLRNRWVENGLALMPGEPLFEIVLADSPVADLADPPLGDLTGLRTRSGGFLDYDADGCLDVFAGHFVGAALGNAGNRNRLYRSDCAGGFTDATESSEIYPGEVSSDYRASLSFLAAQLDDDTHIDMYVVNAAGQNATNHVDQLYRNDGDGTFTEEIGAGLAPGIGDDSQDGMGIDVADIDLDGDWDLYLADAYDTIFDAEPLGNPLYLGNGDGSFADNSAVAAGVDADFTWPVLFFDADQDGYEDLFVGYSGPPDPAKQEFFFHNDGDGTFTDLGPTLWPKDPTEALQTHGAAAADFDRDGDLDLAIVYENDVTELEKPPLRLWRNEATSGTGNWLQLRLVGCESNRDAIGAVVKLQVGERLLMRQVKNAVGSNSQNDRTVHFGLGAADHVDSIEVRWPRGQVTTVVDGAAGWTGAVTETIPADTVYTIVEGNRESEGFRFSQPVPFEVEEQVSQQLDCDALRVPEPAAGGVAVAAWAALATLARRRAVR